MTSAPDAPEEQDALSVGAAICIKFFDVNLLGWEAGKRR